MAKAKKRRTIYQAANARRKRPLREAGESTKAHLARVKAVRGAKGKVVLVSAKPGHHPDQPTRKVAQIKSGARHRRDFGDLNALARSITERGGLLQPIVITKDNKLIAGERRLRAWSLTPFKDSPIPVHVVDIDSIVAGEWDENAQRKDFTPSEAVAIKRALEPVERAKAKERLAQGSKARFAYGGAGVADAGRAADKVAEFLGRDRKTIAKAEEVVAAAKQNPKRFGALVEQMDKTGKVNGAYKRLQIMRQTDAIKKAKPGVPMKGPYGAAIIDHPWWYDGADVSQDEIDAAGRSLRPYPAMAFAAGKAFYRGEVAPILSKDCVVGMWTTNFHMPYAFEFLKALGFGVDDPSRPPHSTILTWNKVKPGRGAVLREVTEHLIIAKRGKVTIDLGNETTLLTEGRRGNSQKPDGIYALFEKVFPAKRYADIFSCGGRSERWDCHGDQIGKFVPAVVQAATEAVLAEAKDPAKDNFLLELVRTGCGVLGKATRARLLKDGLIVFPKGSKRAKLTPAGEQRLKALRDAVLSELPSSIDDLCQAFRAEIANLHNAIVAGDRAAAEAAADRHELLQVKANGGDNFGMAVESSQAEILRRQAAAPIGAVPLWGQGGLFRLVVNETPHLVHYNGDDHFAVYAEDPDRPFVSETGYYSFYCADLDDLLCKTVDHEVAAVILHAIAFDDSSGKPKARKDKLALPQAVYAMPDTWQGGSGEQNGPRVISKKKARDRLKAAAGLPIAEATTPIDLPVFLSARAEEAAA